MAQLSAKDSSKRKMKIFHTIQAQYAILGISPPNQSNENCSFNGRIFFGFSVFGCLLLSQFIYLFSFTNDFMSYMNCISSILGSILIFVCFARVVFRATALFKTIDNAEKLIETSQSMSQIETLNYTNKNYLNLNSF